MAERLNCVIFEDNDDDVMLLREGFELADIACDLQAFGDGSAAEDYLGKISNDAIKTPDVVLLDLNLPGMDGNSILRMFKAHEAFKTVPIAVLTGSDNSQDVMESFKYAASQYLKKPSNLDDCVALAKQVELIARQYTNLKKDG